MKYIRLLFFPISVIYGTISVVRNWLYDQRIFKSSEFDIPIVCIGNLSMGGTGKTPHTEYLIRLLKDKFNTAVLSRGYGRKTWDYILASEGDNASTIGDEPFQYFKKFNEIDVAVEKKRVKGVLNLMYDRPSTEVILLDDAFQHRSIKAGFNILLTEYNKPFTQDLILPMGDLREFKLGSRRADVIIITKCPQNYDSEKFKDIIKPGQSLFYSQIQYGKITNIFDGVETKIDEKDIVLVTGIANPSPLIKELEVRNLKFTHKQYPDHHRFSAKDAAEISRIFGNFASPNKIILTTEKDATRLVEIDELKDLPIYSIEIEIKLSEEERFNKLIDEYIGSIKSSEELPE